MSSTKRVREKKGLNRVEATAIGEEGGSIKKVGPEVWQRRLIAVSALVLLVAPFANLSFFLDESAQTRERLENCYTFVGRFSEEASRACIEGYAQQEGKIALFRPAPKFGYYFSYLVFAAVVLNGGVWLLRKTP